MEKVNEPFPAIGFLFLYAGAKHDVVTSQQWTDR
jgi:hypothetical protein